MQIDTLYLPIETFGWLCLLQTYPTYLDPIFRGVHCHWHRGTSHIRPHLRELLLCCPWCHHPSSLPSTWPFGSPINKQHGPTFHSKPWKYQLSKGGSLLIRKSKKFLSSLSHPNWSNKIDQIPRPDCGCAWTIQADLTSKFHWQHVINVGPVRSSRVSSLSKGLETAYTPPENEHG